MASSAEAACSRAQLLPRDRVPIRLAGKGGDAVFVTLTSPGDQLFVAVHERQRHRSRGGTASASGLALGRQRLFLSVAEIINIETDAERAERMQRVAPGVRGPKGAARSGGSSSGCCSGGGGGGADTKAGSAPPCATTTTSSSTSYHLWFLPEGSGRRAAVQCCSFDVDATPPPAAEPLDDSPPHPALPITPEGPRRAMAEAAAAVLARIYPTGPRRITAFLSPVSGKGAAERMWTETALPILACSRHTTRAIVTERAHHAEELTFAADLTPHDVFVAVGGDGMVHEVLNGVLRRRADRGAGSVPDGFLVALMPAGSGCALAKTLGVLTPQHAAVALVHLRSVAIDVMRLSFFNTTRLEPVLDAKGRRTGAEVAVPVPVSVPDRYAFLSASFAITNEIDKGSERYRWMGNARFTFYTVKLLLGAVPTYRCDVRYIPWRDPNPASPLPGGRMVKAAPDAQSPPYPACTFAEGTCAQCKHNLAAHSPSCPAITAAEGGAVVGESSVFDAAAPGTAEGVAGPSKVASASEAAEPDFGNDEWVALEDRTFAFLMVCNIPFIAQDMHCAPFAHMSDGALDLVYIAPPRDANGQPRPIEKTTFVRIFLAIESGKHVESPEVHYIKARAVEITPHEGITMADGELVPSADQPLAGVRAVALHRAAHLVRGAAL